MQHTPDTITAISTPPGRGAIGIVRLSGPEALAIAAQLLSLKQPLTHAHARFTHVLDDTGATLDDAVVTAFLAPHSYTGEDLVEIAAHGSPIVLDAILRRALTLGARLAEPGEFSRRAFLSGRLDLTQAEAIHDLIAAQTLAQARTAAQQLGGSLSRRIAPIKERLVHTIAMLEAGMDFASGELDDVDTMPPARIAAALTSITEPLTALAATFRSGSLQRSGATLALVGRPNAGKSSLFNRLLDRERAIVTAIPGTTRDTIEESLSLDGIPLRLVDTAGLRYATDPNAPTIDEAEALGIARSREALAEADLILLIQDATNSEPFSFPFRSAAEESAFPTDATEITQLFRDRPTLHILNKIDLLPPSSPLLSHSLTPSLSHSLTPSLSHSPHPHSSHPHSLTPSLPHSPLPTSALTGQGLDALRDAILQTLRSGSAATDDASLNNLRQLTAVQNALTALSAATAANSSGLPHELILVDLHTALQSLDTLTGTTTSDDILTLIFSTFCIGK